MQARIPALLFLFFFVLLTVKAQNKETQALIQSISGQWETNSSGHAVYKHEIAVPGASREDLYFMLYDYLHINYGELGLKEQNQEKGILLAAGIYPRVQQVGKGASKHYLNATHEIHLTILDERIHAQVILTGYTSYYQVTNHGQYGATVSNINSNYNIADLYPINLHTSKLSLSKNLAGQAFYECNRRALQTLYQMEDLFYSGAGQ